jgi:hypothetical protein
MSASGWMNSNQEKLTPLLRLKYRNSIADAVSPTSASPKR